MCPDLCRRTLLSAGYTTLTQGHAVRQCGFAISRRLRSYAGRDKLQLRKLEAGGLTTFRSPVWIAPSTILVTRPSGAGRLHHRQRAVLVNGVILRRPEN